MGEFIDAFVLSIVQGLTEFLPISSSGHLVLFEDMFGFVFGGMDTHLLNVILHLGTMCATVIVFRFELRSLLLLCFSLRFFSFLRSFSFRGDRGDRGDRDERFLLLIIVGSVPTGVIGLLFRDSFKALERGHLWVVGILFLVTGFILFLTRYYDVSRARLFITMWEALLIGFAQGLAIAPGISRSGITISVGMLKGIDQDLMVRYSFLLSFPAILAATVLELFEVSWLDIDIFPFVLGFLGSFVSGYFALRLLIGFIKRGKLWYFSYYCFGLGIFILFFFLYSWLYR